MAEQNSLGRPEINVQPYGVTSGSYHLPHTATTLVTNNEYDTDVKRYSLAVGGILSIAKERTAVAHAIRSFLWICGDVKKSHFQECTNDTKYIELCPSYLATVEGVTRWAARQAWEACSSLVGWSEVSRDVAIAFGANIRTIKYGQRWGRHVLFTKQQYSLLVAAAQQARESGLLDDHYKSVGGEHVADVQCSAEHWSGHKRTVAVECPLHHNHKHRDRNPSMILWRPDSRGVGGAMCMVCKNQDGTPLTMAAYHKGGTVSLHVKCDHGSQHAKPINQHRHNKYPTGGSIGPVGGCVASHAHGVFVGAKLFRSGGRSSRSIGGRLSGDPLKALMWSESRSRGPTDSERAAVLGFMSSGPDPFLSEQFETPLCSVSSMKPSGWMDIGNRSAPVGWKSAYQSWVLFDIDDVSGAVDHNQLIGLITSHVHNDEELSGRFAIVQTGPNGYQIWAELREARHSPERWHRSPDVVHWYNRLGRSLVLSIGIAGGHSHFLDTSSCAAGRFGRRPCWRMLSDGSVFRSNLLIACEQRADGRQPRRL